MSDSKPLTLKERAITDAAAEIFGGEPVGDDVGFVHVAFCHVGLPRSRQPGRVFERTSGGTSIRVNAGELYTRHGTWEEQPLPYGPKARLLIMHITREYKRTRDRVIDMGAGITSFARNSLGLETGGRTLAEIRRQSNALAAARLSVGYRDPKRGIVQTDFSQPFKRLSEFPQDDGRQASLWNTTLELTADYAAALDRFAAPVDMRAIRALQDSALALDVYLWLAVRLYQLKQPKFLPWPLLRGQFGQEYNDPKNFRKAFRVALTSVLAVYPHAHLDAPPGGLLLRPSRPPVLPAPRTVVGIDLQRSELGPSIDPA